MQLAESKNFKVIKIREDEDFNLTDIIQQIKDIYVLSS
jgi:hypothetical protein